MNTVLVQTAISTVENKIFSAKFQFYLTMVLNLCIMSGLKERLNSKTIAPGAMKKVFGNQVLQEKLDLVDVKLKPIENKGILIENGVCVRFIWASCQSLEFAKLNTGLSSIKMYHGGS